MNKNNAVIYIRVSTTEQAEFGYSLKAQEEICLDYAIRNKYEVLRVFIERGESATTINRTELNKMLSFIKTNKNKVNTLIVFNMDRLSRKTYDSLTIRQILEKLNIDLKSVNEPFDLKSPVGSLTATIFSSFAQFENDIRTERTVMGMKQAIKEGRWLWKAPFGYTLKYKNQKSLLIPSDYSHIVKKIFNYFINGKRQYEIINELKKFGIKIKQSHLNAILRNPIYIGKLKTRLFEELISGIHEPLIDEITFYKVQNILNPKENYKYNMKYVNEFPLKRFLKCPSCNKSLAGSYSTGRNKKYAYYHCVTKGCHFKPIRKEVAEELFVKYLNSFGMQEDIINEIFDKVKYCLNEKQGDNEKIITNLKKEITLLENKKDKIDEFAINGTFSKDTYHKKVNEVENEIVSKKILLSDHKEGLFNISELIDFAKKFLLNLSSLWMNMDNGHKITFQEALFPKDIYLENNEFRTTQINPILRLIQDQKKPKLNPDFCLGRCEISNQFLKELLKFKKFYN